MKDFLIDPKALNVRHFCANQQHLANAWPMADLARLRESLFEEPAAGQVVNWTAQGSQASSTGAEPEVWLHLLGAATVTLQCQRCLQAVDLPLQVDRRFRFVRTEEQAEQLDEMSEDDVLVLNPKLDAVELLEDELILALPLVPRHEGDCPSPLPLPVDDLAPEEPAPNPFAALAALRKGRQGAN